VLELRCRRGIQDIEVSYSARISLAVDMLGDDVISVSVLQLDGEVLRGIRVSSTRMPGLVSASKPDVSGILGTPECCDSREEWAIYFQGGIPLIKPNAMGGELFLWRESLDSACMVTV
jgi:hypothetical protein